MTINQNNLFALRDVYAALNAECDRIGQKEFARQCGVTPQFVNTVINGRAFPSAPILNKLGFRKAAPVFERINNV